MDQEETSETLTEERALRELSRRKAEGSFIRVLSGVLAAGNEREQRFQREEFLRVLQHYTSMWQLESSGEFGELMTRWVGRGLLVDFPKVGQFSDDDNYQSSIDIEDGDKGRKYVNSRIVIGPMEDLRAVHYRFYVSQEDLEKRQVEVDQEREMYEALLSSGPT